MIVWRAGFFVLFLVVVASVNARPNQENLPKQNELDGKLNAKKIEKLAEEKEVAVAVDAKENDAVIPEVLEDVQPEKKTSASGSNESKNKKKKDKVPYKYSDPIDACKILFSDDTTDVEVRAHAAWELARRSLEELRKIEDRLKKSSGRGGKRGSSSSASSSSDSKSTSSENKSKSVAEEEKKSTAVPQDIEQPQDNQQVEEDVEVKNDGEATANQE